MALRYYAMLRPGSTREDPNGVGRRGTDESGKAVEEAFGRDRGWHWTESFLRQDYKGDLTYEFEEITAEDAEAIIAGWIAKWDAEDSPG